MGRIETLGPDDRDEVLDHLELVFSADHGPQDFARKLPHCYRPEDMRRQYVIREKGRIQSLVGMFERPWVVGAVTLSVVGIGGVSTHPTARGRGHMKSLLRHCLAQMRSRGTDASWLQGHRLRYAWFGYERCGTLLEVRLRPGEVRAHAPTELSFEPLPADDTVLDTLFAWHSKRPVRHARPRDLFAQYLRSWHCKPWIARDPAGDVVGYLSHQPDEAALFELGAADPDGIVDVACAWVRAHGAHTLYFPPERALTRRLIALAGGACTLVPSGNWQVFEWNKVLRALLAQRAARGPTQPGAVVLGITSGPTLRIQSDGATFEIADAPASRAEVQWNALTAMRALFGPSRPSAVVDLPPSAELLLDQWCPLPLPWDKQDGV